jgi:hypothetical protein
MSPQTQHGNQKKERYKYLRPEKRMIKLLAMINALIDWQDKKSYISGNDIELGE